MQLSKKVQVISLILDHVAVSVVESGIHWKSTGIELVTIPIYPWSVQSSLAHACKACRSNAHYFLFRGFL